MRDEKEERKKQARSNKQTRQSNTAHPRQSLFLEKMSCLRWDMYIHTAMSYIISVSYIHSADLVGVVVASQMCIDEQIWQLCDPESGRGYSIDR